MRNLLLVFGLPALLAAQQPAAPTCTVSGSVVNSLSGEPIPHARVAVLGAAGGRTSRADNGGRFSFSDLPCGPVSFSANHPAFIQNSANASTATDDLKIKLTPQAVLAGKIVDELGEPVPRAMVTVLVSVVLQGKRAFRQRDYQSTNDLGEYRVFGLAAGKYIVCARAVRVNEGANDPSAVAEICYPGPVEGGVSSALNVTAGLESRVVLTLPRVPAFHVRGVLNGPKNQNPPVRLSRRGVSDSAGDSLATARDGHFDIAAVTAGSYTLSIDAWDAGKRLTARVPVEVGTHDVENVSVQLEQAFAVTGTVRMEAKSGTPLPTAEFALRAQEPSVGGGPTQWNKEHTAFALTFLPPGSYRLEGSLPPPFYIKSALLNGHDISREEIPISQQAGPIDIVISDDAGAVEGDVTDADGTGKTGLVVLISRDGRSHWVFAYNSGHFKISGLPSGDYRAYAWDDQNSAEYENPEWVKRFSPVSVSVQTGQTAPLKLTLLKAGL